MLDQIENIRKDANLALDLCDSKAKLDEWKIKFLGRKSELLTILKDIKNLDPDLRKQVGSLGNKVRNELETKFQSLILAMDLGKLVKPP